MSVNPMMVKNEFQKLWDKYVVAYFRALSWRSLCAESTGNYRSD